jgi:hypothetical protein
MSVGQAEIVDLALSAFQRRRKLESLPRVESENLILDMSDVIVVAMLMLKFAGFSWSESSLFAVILGIAGNSKDGIALYDKDIAEIAGCSVRTVRRWRKTYLQKARGLIGPEGETKRYSPLGITEGNYDRKKQLHEPTTYHVAITPLIERCVWTARAMPEYQTDRLTALENAASLHYDDIPDAPYRQRIRKPHRSIKAAVPAHVSNTLKNAKKAKIALGDLNPRTREDLLDIQGTELRNQLLESRRIIDELLSMMPETVENTESEGGTGQSVRYVSDDVWQRYETLLMAGRVANVTMLKSRAAPLMSPAEVRACRNEVRAILKEMSQDSQLWLAYLAEAEGYRKTGKMPAHSDAKARTLLLSCEDHDHVEKRFGKSS